MDEAMKKARARLDEELAGENMQNVPSDSTDTFTDGHGRHFIGGALVSHDVYFAHAKAMTEQWHAGYRQALSDVQDAAGRLALGDESIRRGRMGADT